MFKTDKINPDTGKPVYKFMPAGSQRRDLFDNIKDYDVMLIPCGKCVGCRLDYSRSWADRMMLELETAKKAIFITLTYNNTYVPTKCISDDIPIGFTVSKRDVQLFMKRLRRKYDGIKLRFYLSSEYGPTTRRPHYHAIIFGLGIDDFPDKIPHGKNELGQQYYELPAIQEVWAEYDSKGNRIGDLGYVLGSDVSYQTCAYVARYVMKKVRDNPKWSKENGVDPEFNLMSRNPGIGAEYLKEHPDCMDFTSINISTEDGAKKIMIPKYFLRKLEFTDPEKYAILKEQRKELADDRIISKLSRTTLSYLDQLEVEEESKLRSVAALKRGDL